MTHSQPKRIDSPLLANGAGAKNPKRIAYVVKRYPRYSETFIVNEILAHEAAGLEVEVFALRPPSDTHFQEAISRVRASVHYVPYSGVRANTFWKAITKLVKTCPRAASKLPLGSAAQGSEAYQAAILAMAVVEHGIDHMHAHFATTSTTVARLASLFTGVPYSFTAHAKDIFHESVIHEELRSKIDDAQNVITVSEFNLAFLREKFPKVRDRIKLVYNGLDLEEFPYASPAERSPKIVAVGRLVEKKGFADLIIACEKLHAQGVEFSCEIIGGGELREELQEQIDARNLGAFVQLTGPKPRRKVMEALRSAAVMVAPCVEANDGNRDGLPTILLEAMALGTPCISTKVTGIPEIVIDEETGLLLEPGQPEQLAKSIQRMLTEKELREEVARNARQLMETSFDIHKNTKGMRKLLHLDTPPRLTTKIPAQQTLSHA